jgi:hypothetical protein
VRGKSIIVFWEEGVKQKLISVPSGSANGTTPFQKRGRLNY